MINLSYIKKFPLYFIFTCIVFLSCLFVFSRPVHAMKPSCYSYKKLYDALPKKYQKSTYIYEADGVAKVSFATYTGSGSDYRTSVKHDGDTLYYCVNYSAHFDDDLIYGSSDSVYSNELNARIALAMKLGTTEWGKLANA